MRPQSRISPRPSLLSSWPRFRLPLPVRSLLKGARRSIFYLEQQSSHRGPRSWLGFLVLIPGPPSLHSSTTFGVLGKLAPPPGLSPLTVHAEWSRNFSLIPNSCVCLRELFSPFFPSPPPHRLQENKREGDIRQA